MIQVIKGKKRIIEWAGLLLALLVLALSFQNCSNKGQIDLRSEPPVTVQTMQAPVYIDAGSADGVDLFGYNTVIQDAERGAVFQFTGNTSIVSGARVKIDMNREYRLSGRFRSSGTTLSNIYFGVATYRSDGRHIDSWEGTRTGFPGVVSNVTLNSINTSNTLLGWNTGAMSSYYKAIGFYFDGNTNRLPDYVLTNWGTGAVGTDAGAYNTATGTSVQLNVFLPSEVTSRLTSKTRIHNHYAGGSYVYTAAQNNQVPATWQEFSGTISGFDMANSYNRFRAETDHIGLLILPNYQQDSTAVLLVDDLKFEVVD